jgi:hypothetical protein
MLKMTRTLLLVWVVSFLLIFSVPVAQPEDNERIVFVSNRDGNG